MFDSFKKCLDVILFFILSITPLVACSSDKHFNECLDELKKHTDIEVFDIGEVIQVQREKLALIRVTFDKSNSHNASFSMCEFYEGSLFNMEFILNGIESRFTFNTLIYEKFYDEDSYQVAQKEKLQLNMSSKKSGGFKKDN